MPASHRVVDPESRARHTPSSPCPVCEPEQYARIARHRKHAEPRRSLPPHPGSWGHSTTELRPVTR